MIRVRQIDLDINDQEDSLLKKCANKLKIKKEEILNLKIHKKSLDARKKPQLFYVYEVDVEVLNEERILRKNKSLDILKTPNENYQFKVTGSKILKKRPVIVGSGPAGLFCAYFLAEAGYKPLIIERGKKVEERVEDVENFWKTGRLNINSNVQFGEGGAGTFSDGKLNTLVKDKTFRQKKVLEIFVECGAPEEILYLNKPHIGTDLLRNLIINMREKIKSMGGEFKYNTTLTDIIIENNKIKQIEVNHQDLIDTEILVLALGHSARDTFEMLLKRNLKMSPKPFAVGIRIEHPQKMINLNQYGKGNENLPAASYKLTYNTKDNRGVYTFCMCPGGYIVNSSSEENRLAINGMSNHKRDSKNSNSAVIVTVGPKDFGNNPLDGMNLQRTLEKKAYQVGQTKIPIQTYKDFKLNKTTTTLGEVEPIFKGSYNFANLNDIFPKYIVNSLIEGIDHFDRIIPGYGRNDAILAAVESRTSSPIRIERNDLGFSSTEGIYPAGEGAGYAGGITSAAIDGIKTAENIAKIYFTE